MSCSIALFVANASAVDYGQARKRLLEASSNEARQALVRALSEERLDQRLRLEVNYLLTYESFGREDVADLAAMLGQRELLLNSEPMGDREGPRRVAADIKRSPYYRDPGVSQSSNWIQRALQSLADLLGRSRGPKPVRPPSLPSARLDWIVTLAWILLGVGLAAFLVFVVRHFAWRNRLRRNVASLLGEDEPDRTMDEWLRLAEEWAAKGEFRIAVRCLYLACLMKFDEHGIARFNRGETNWEHLRRIEQSATRPEGLDFRPATQAFDRVWYGFKVRGRVDVDDMRESYRQVKETLEGVAA